jgi:hypothetical protein
MALWRQFASRKSRGLSSPCAFWRLDARPALAQHRRAGERARHERSNRNRHWPERHAHCWPERHAQGLWRIVPLVALGYLCAYMDRVNVGFAAVRMNADLGFSATVYGLGAGLFFWAALLEIPSNLMAVRMGSRRWLARIMISWGGLPPCFSCARRQFCCRVSRWAWPRRGSGRG